MENAYNVILDAVEDLDDVVRPRFSAWISDEFFPAMFTAGVKLDATAESHIDGCGGYFCDDDGEGNPLLTVACGNDMWPQTLLHEWNHAQQFFDKAEVWTDGLLPSGDYGSDLIELWYGGYVELTEEQLTRYYEPILAVELDCEKRSVRMIVDLDLPFHTEEYAKAANAYLLGHSELRRRRSWFVPGKAPYAFQSILDEMPTDFVTASYSFEPLPIHLQHLYDQSFPEETWRKPK
tara:strand:- start:8655 stop:9359 length:705 start_codon:yes stop_codon:yes gene_type:complete